MTFTISTAQKNIENSFELFLLNYKTISHKCDKLLEVVNNLRVI